MSSDSDIDQDHCSPSDHCDDPCTCRPALPRMKSCLKSSPSHSGAATPVHTDPDSGSLPLCKKRVAFSEQGTEQVFQADEWDRTPTEIAQRLSYEDVLELKMIQRSLPRAEQQHDPLSSRPYSSVFLRHVPIPLLPLNPITVSASASPSPSSTSPSSPSSSPPSSPPAFRFPHSSPPRRTGYTALDLHPNSIFFSSPPKRKSKPTSPQETQFKAGTRSPHAPPPPFEGFRPRNIPVVTPPPPAPSELRPHNIAVPPPPIPPAPVRTSTTSLSPIPSNLPPKRFAFLPLLDDTSSSPPSIPQNEGKKENESVSSPQTDMTLSLVPSHIQLDSRYPRPDSSSEIDHNYSSDTDCSLFASDTEFSTPSLTTASLASSSPPESPRMSYTSSPALEHAHVDDSFILNLDTDPDVDATSSPSASDSYFSRMPMPMSMTPISSFHMRHPHRAPQPSLLAVPSPDLPVPSPLDLTQSQRHPYTPVSGSKKKFSMPILPLAEAPASSSKREKETSGFTPLRMSGKGQEDY